MKNLLEKTKSILEDGLDQNTINEIKSELLKRKETLLNSLKSLASEDHHEADKLAAKFPEYGDKADENAQEVSDYGTNIGTEKVLEKALEDIESTIKRIENGEYGICKYCKGPIAKKRLLARPVASSCISCKKELQEND
jgi:DnaK suppressor protein